MKTPEGRRRIEAAETRQGRSLGEHLEEKMAPPVHGGEVAEDVVVGEPLHFEPFEPAALEEREPVIIANDDVDAAQPLDDDNRMPATPARDDREVLTPRDDNDMDMGVVESEMPLEKLIAMMDQTQAQETRVAEAEVLSLVRSLGGNVHSYKKERAKALRNIVSEIYSPPRVTAIAKMCPSFVI